MDSGFVGKSVFSHDGFIRLNLYSRDSRQKLGGTHDLLRDDTGIRVVEILSRLQRHDDFFQGRISGALSDAVDGAFQLSDARTDGRQRICHRQAQVIVTVNGDIHRIESRTLFPQLCEECEIFLRHDISYSIRTIDGRRSRFYDAVKKLRQKVHFSSRGVLCGKFHVGNVFFRMLYHGFGAFQYLLRLHEQLVFHVNRRRGDESVNSRRNGIFDRLISSVDIRRKRAAQAGDSAVFQSLRYRLDRKKISRRGCRKTGFNDVDVQSFQLLCHLDLFFHVHAAAR